VSISVNLRLIKKIGFTVKEKQKAYGKRAKKSKKYGELGIKDSRSFLPLFHTTFFTVSPPSGAWMETLTIIRP